MSVIVILLIVVVIILIAVLASAVKIVRPYPRGLVERLGKYKDTRTPGLQLIVPFIETMQLIDMRAQVVDVPPQEVITSDNVVVSVDDAGTIVDIDGFDATRGVVDVELPAGAVLRRCPADAALR